jgi:hypothetical protein
VRGKTLIAGATDKYVSTGGTNYAIIIPRFFGDFWRNIDESSQDAER